jgi:predicted amidohydrolase YtcJ
VFDDPEAAQPNMVTVPGLIDTHTHLLWAAAGVPFPWDGTTIASFHRKVASDASTPMDIPEPSPGSPISEMANRLYTGLASAANVGLVEITEMGMRAWWYMDALSRLEKLGSLPVRVRIYIASGLAESTGLREMDARRSDCGPRVRLEGVKFYADGWLGPRTCAMCQPFSDSGDAGLLFMDAETLARRIEPLAAGGWRIATHAIGDRGIEAVLDAYETAWGGDRSAIAAARPRIEHASIQSRDLTARIAELGVAACIQPSFAVTDASEVPLALGPARKTNAYPWATMTATGVHLLVGSDYPIEVLEPLVGLARLVNGHSEREGFKTPACAPVEARLDVTTAFGLLSDVQAGETTLSADPRAIPATELDHVEVLETSVRPFEE